MKAGKISGKSKPLWGGNPYLTGISKAIFVAGILLLVVSCLYLAANLERADELWTICSIGMVTGLLTAVISLLIARLGRRF